MPDQSPPPPDLKLTGIFTKDEFWPVAKLVKPDLTPSEYDHMFDENMLMKADYLRMHGLT